MGTSFDYILADVWPQLGTHDGACEHSSEQEPAWQAHMMAQGICESAARASAGHGLWSHTQSSTDMALPSLRSPRAWRTELVRLVRNARTLPSTMANWQTPGCGPPKLKLQPGQLAASALTSETRV